MPHESFLEPEQTTLQLPTDEKPYAQATPKITVPKLTVPTIHISQEKIKHTSKQLLMWVLVLILFISAGVAIFFFLHQSTPVKTASLPLAAQEPVNPTVTSTPIPTPSIQPFSDSRLIFTLSFPASWGKPNISEANLKYTVDFGHGFSIMQASNPALNQQRSNASTLSAWIDNEHSTLRKQKNISAMTTMAITVNGIPASKISYHNTTSGENVTEVLLAHEKTIIIATFTLTPDDMTMTDVISQILSTLTITDASAPSPTIGL